MSSPRSEFTGDDPEGGRNPWFDEPIPPIPDADRLLDEPGSTGADPYYREGSGSYPAPAFEGEPVVTYEPGSNDAFIPAGYGEADAEPVMVREGEGRTVPLEGEIVDPPTGRGPEAPIEVEEVPRAGEPNEPPGETLPPLPTDPVYHIQKLNKVEDAEGKLTTVNKPSQGAVIDAAQAGEVQRLVVTGQRNPSAGQKFEVKFEASASLLPQDATIDVPPDTGRPPDVGMGPAETRTAPTSGEVAQAGADPDGFRYWVRIRADRRVPEENQTKNPNDPANGLDLEHFLSRSSDADFKLVIQARSVPDEIRDEFTREFQRLHYNASRTEGDEGLAKEYEAFLGVLGKSQETELVHRTAVVGVKSLADLERISRLMAGTGFISGDQTSWRVEVDAATRRPIRYNSEQDAMGAGLGDPGAIITAEQFADEITLPKEQVPGLGMSRIESFASNREIPDDVPSIRFADIVYKGQVVSELRIPIMDLKRHTFIGATSGGGKTVLIHNMVTELSKYLEEQRQQNGGEVAPEDHCGKLIIDFEKIGNHGQRLAGKLKAAGIDGEAGDVHVISPGSDGTRPNINLLKPVGNNTMLQQVELAMRALSVNIPDAHAQFVFRKWGTAAIMHALSECGYDEKTGEPLYPLENGSPPIPTMEQVALAIKEVMTSTDFQKASKGDIGSFTESTLADAMNGIPGQLFQEGYDIDWEAIRANKGVTVIELGHINSLEAKKIMLTAILHSVAAVLKAENQAEGSTGDTNKMKMMVVMDETGGILDEGTASGEDAARFWSTVRGYGMAMVVAQQTVTGLHKFVSQNMVNRFIMHMADEHETESALKQLNVSRSRFLNNVKAGEGLFHGPDMPDGPAAIRVPKPNEESLPNASHHVKGCERVVDQGYDLKFYRTGLEAQAKRFLTETELGTVVRGVVEISTYLVITGRDTPKITGELKEALKAVSGTPEQDLRDKAITLAVQLAVNSRPQILAGARLADVIKYVRDDLLAQIDDTGKVVKPRNLYIPIGKYAAVKDLLNNALLARRLEDTPRYQAAFNAGLTDPATFKQVSGASATEQLDRLKMIENGSLTVVAQALGPLSDGSISDAAKQRAVLELRNLVGTLDPERGARLVETGLEATMMRAQNQGRGKRPLTEPEKQALSGLMIEVRAARGSSPPPLGYPDMRAALEKSIAQKAGAKAINLEGMSRRYNEQFLQPDAAGKLTAAQQLNDVLEREKTYLKAESLKSLRAPEHPKHADLLFARNPLGPGYTLDQVAAKLIQLKQLTGGIYNAQVKEIFDGKMPSYRIGPMIRRTAPETTQFGHQLGMRLILGDDLMMPLVVSRDLTLYISMVLNNMRVVTQLAQNQQRVMAGTGERKT